MIKISYLGDLMVEGPLLKAAQTEEGYNFQGLFSELAPLLADSDYRVANFETVLRGAAPYQGENARFNTPDAFLESLEPLGLSLVSLANNHILDQGKEAALRTRSILSDRGIASVGVGDAPSRYVVHAVGPLQVAFMALSDTLNHMDQETFTHQGLDDVVNMTCPLPTKKEIFQSKRALYHGPLGGVKFYLARFLSLSFLKGFKDRLQIRLNRKGVVQLAARSDQLLPRHQDSESLARMARMVQDAKKIRTMWWCSVIAAGSSMKRRAPTSSFLRIFSNVREPTASSATIPTSFRRRN